jgi:hypothetical protein
VYSPVFVEIPYSSDQGILKREQESFRQKLGIFCEQQGSRFRSFQQSQRPRSINHSNRKGAEPVSATDKHIQPGYTTITPYLYAKIDLADFLKKLSAQR